MTSQPVSLQAALARSRKQVVMLGRLSALHKAGRDEARDDLHAARRALSAVQGLLAAVESDGQHHVTVEAVRAAMSPERGTA